MADALGVQVVESLHNLVQHSSGYWLLESLGAFDVIEELVSGD